MRNQAQVLLKRSCTLGKLVNTQTKELHAMYRKNTICISCVLMALSIHVKGVKTFQSIILLLIFE